MLNDEEIKARQELIELHRSLAEYYESLKSIDCNDNDFKQLIDSIRALVEKSAELVAEVATVFFPVQANTNRPKRD